MFCKNILVGIQNSAARPSAFKMLILMHPRCKRGWTQNVDEERVYKKIKVQSTKGQRIEP